MHKTSFRKFRMVLVLGRRKAVNGPGLEEGDLRIFPY